MESDLDFDADLYVAQEDFEHYQDFELARTQARVNKAIRINNQKVLAKSIWDLTWSALYADGYYCRKGDVAVALKAYNHLGYDSFIEHSSQSIIKSSEAVANLACQAAHAQLSMPIEIPPLVTRMIKAYYILNSHKSKPIVIRALLEIYHSVANTDLKWFSNLNRS